MLILFDHVTPKGIARSLIGHTVIKAKDRGWDTFSNDDLLAAAEQAGFDVFVTADKNMRYQQNLSGRRISSCRAQHSAMAGCKIESRKNRRCRKRRDTRQLHRSRI
jgi:hypothetical protein